MKIENFFSIFDFVRFLKKVHLKFVTNSIRTVQLKNWTIWTYFASTEAFLPKIPLFTKIEADRD
jgi:hypothetical protein